MRNKTFIIGCGRLGAALALRAYRRGQNVTVLDAVKESFDRLGDNFAGYTHVCEVTDVKALEELGIENARIAIVTTGDDNVNLFLAHVLDVIFAVPHIYVRFNDPDRAALINGDAIKAIYPFKLSLDAYEDLLKEGED